MNTITATQMHQPPGHATNLAVINAISAIGHIIDEVAQTLVLEWAEAANIEEANIFMEDKAKEIIAAHIAGYINKMQPRANQFTDEHASAYFSMQSTSNNGQVMSTV